MDIEMPVMGGIECTKKLKTLMNEGKINGVPIIALTSHTDNNN